MKFSVCVDALYMGEDFFDALREIKKSGLSAFEFWSWWDKDVETIAATAKELDLQTAALCTKMIPLTDKNCHDEFLSGLQESIEVAKKLNCSTLIAQIGPQLEEISREEQMENVVNGLKRCVPELEKAGITLIYEPLNTKVDHQGYFLSTTEDAVRIHDAVNSKWVKILFDFYHQQVSEGDVIRNSVNNLERIGHFHAAGNPGRNEIHRGEMNYPGIFAALEESGYHGWIGLEYFPKEDRFAELCRLAALEKKSAGEKKLHIRKYKEEDFERLAQIHDPARKNELALAGLPDAFVPFSVAAIEEDLFEYEVYVAEWEGTVVGFVAFEPEEIAWLYVDVNYSRKGIGRSLVNFALENTEEHVGLEVLVGNEPAIGLYVSCGFTIQETLSGVMPGNESFHVTVHVMSR